MMRCLWRFLPFRDGHFSEPFAVKLHTGYYRRIIFHTFNCWRDLLLCVQLNVGPFLVFGKTVGLIFFKSSFCCYFLLVWYFKLKKQTWEISGPWWHSENLEARMLKCSRIDSSLLGLLSKNVLESHEEKVIQNFCQKNSIREKTPTNYILVLNKD